VAGAEQRRARLLKTVLEKGSDSVVAEDEHRDVSIFDVSAEI